MNERTKGTQKPTTPMVTIGPTLSCHDDMSEWCICLARLHHHREEKERNISSSSEAIIIFSFFLQKNFSSPSLNNEQNEQNKRWTRYAKP